MRSRLMILAAFVALCVFGASGHADETATKDQIKALVVEINKAFAKRDVATIKRLARADHIAVAAYRGKPVGLEEQLKSQSELKRQPSDFSPINVTMLGDSAALVTFENSLKGTWKGKPLPARVFVSEIWIHQDGKWRQRFYQETPIDSP